MIGDTCYFLLATWKRIGRNEVEDSMPCMTMSHDHDP